MEPGMLSLVERLVSAAESVSKDVNSISLVMRTMGHDLSRIASHLLQREREREDIPMEPFVESLNVLSSPLVAEEEASHQSEHILKHEQAIDTVMRQVDERENDRQFLGNAASRMPGYDEDTDNLPTPSEVPVTQEVVPNHLTSNGEHNVFGINDNIALEEIEDKIDLNEDWFPSPDVSNVFSMRRAQEEKDYSSDTTSRPSTSKHSVLITHSKDSVPGLYSCSEVDNSENANGGSADIIRQYSSHSGESPQRKCTEKEGREKQSQRQNRTCENLNCSGTEERCRGTEGKQDRCKEGKWSSSQKSSPGQRRRRKKTRGPLICTACGKRFSRMASFENHQRTHTGEKPFECTVCYKAFGTEGNLMFHMKVHSEERPFKCPICYKAFKRGGNLKEHQQVHSMEKQYMCTVCKKEFSRKYTLTIHMRSHSGEKPYGCQECGKVFTVRSNLISHIRSHTGERPYKCTMCGKAFKLRNHLISHMRSHL